MNKVLVFSVPGEEVLRLVLAGSFLARARGLLAHRSLARGAGMLITPCWMVHTIGMRMHIDIVFVDRQWIVVGLAREVPPNRIRWALRGRAVIELARGEIDRLSLSPGAPLAPIQEDAS